MYHALLRLIVFIFLILQLGCAALLPQGKDVAQSPWKDYETARKSYDGIVVGKTTEAELKELGFDIEKAPNLRVLNYLDIVASIQTIPPEELDPGLRSCVKARSDCRAYLFQPGRLSRERVGNFWLDILDFRRKTHQTGWIFSALIICVDRVVTYKVASSQPRVDKLQDQENPLGFIVIRAHQDQPETIDPPPNRNPARDVLRSR